MGAHSSFTRLLGTGDSSRAIGAGPRYSCRCGYFVLVGRAAVEGVGVDDRAGRFARVSAACCAGS